jgi:hypothetical protein
MRQAKTSKIVDLPIHLDLKKHLALDDRGQSPGASCVQRF